MKRNNAIGRLAEITLSEDIGIGGYTDSAAYKLANGDIKSDTPGLDDETREWVALVGSLEWSEIGR